MKAICIKNYDEVNSRTTIGKVYEICQEYNSSEDVDCSEYFVCPIQRERDNKLNEIGI